MSSSSCSAWKSESSLQAVNIGGQGGWTWLLEISGRGGAEVALIRRMGQGGTWERTNCSCYRRVKSVTDGEQTSFKLCKVSVSPFLNP